MNKSAVLIIFAVMLITGQTCAGKQAIMYDRSLSEWTKTNIKSYYIKVNYRAFSPLQGQWELEVKDGDVVRASFNGTWDKKYIKTAEHFTVDSIYKTAETVRSGKADGPMVINAEFSDAIPYIKSVSRVNNADFKGSVKKDTGFSIVILEFRKD